MKALLNSELDPKKKVELSKLLDQVRQYYCVAEEKLKLVESVELNLVIPASNQLRYAGCHLSRACVEEDVEIILRDLDKAQRHCKRAIYDALEVGILNFLENIKVFQNDYRLIRISSIVNNYIDMSVRVQSIRDYIVSPRDFQREEYWTQCTSAFEDIKNISVKLEHSRDELNKLRNDRTISERRYYIALALVFIGTIAAVLALRPLFVPSKEASPVVQNIVQGS